MSIITIDRGMVDDLDFGGLVYRHKRIRIVQGPRSMFQANANQVRDLVSMEAATSLTLLPEANWCSLE